MKQRNVRSSVAVLAGFTLVLAACGSDSSSESEPDETLEPADGDDAGAAAATTEAPAAEADLPTIVVTTNILGDVAGEVFGDSADVVTVMPVGADPHDFQASAQEVDAMMNADVLIVNGAGLEEGLLDVIESAEDEGVPTFEAISVVDTIEFGEGGHDHGDEDHDHDGDEAKDEEDHDHDHEGDEDHGDEDHDHDGDEAKDVDGDHDHDHSGDDPHFWLDPMSMAAVVDGMVEFAQSEIDIADPAALEASAAAYIEQLESLDADSEAQFESISEENRVLVTNHDNLGYFADHYGFEVVGTVIPTGSTTDATSAGELAELAEVLEAEGVSAIFADNSASQELTDTLAAEVGDVEVVVLYTGSLGEPGSDGETYLLMMGANAERITGALA